MRTIYNVGTASVAPGGTTVTGVDTFWVGKVFEGDLFTDPAQGLFARVTADATVNTSLSINPWPGLAVTSDPYEILLQADSVRMSERMRKYVELAGAVANTGIGIDAFGDFADRAGYDSQIADFTYLSLDGDGGSLTEAVIFIKASSDPGDWADPILFQGQTGAPGVSAGLPYTFDSTITDADPGLGLFRGNHATPASITKIWIDNTTVDGALIGPVIDQWDDLGTADLRGILMIRSKLNYAILWVFSVTGSVINKTGYRELTVAAIATTGAIANGTDCDVSFTAVGQQGEGLQIDASGSLAGRDAYDAEGEGFVYLATDTGELYVRETVTAGVWSTAVDLTAAPSNITTTGGVGNGTAGPYPLDADPTGGSIISVSAGGVAQYDYSIVANSITFGLAIETGVPWQVKTVNTLSIGEPSDDTVDANKIDGTDAAAIRTKIGAGTGDTTGAASSVDGDLAFFSGVSGKVLKTAVLGLTEEQKGRARGIIGADVLGGFRNKLINPRFDITQRGLSFTSPGFTADRWNLTTWGTGGSGTVAVVKHPSNGNAYLTGRRNVLTWDRTAGTTVSRLQQKIEGVNTLAGKTVTALVLCYTTGGTHDLSIRIDQDFGTGGSPSAYAQGVAQTQSIVGGTPQLLKFVFPVPSIAGKTLGTNVNDYLLFIMDSPVSGAFGIRILDVALVDGDTTGETDPFSPRHIEQDEALCQRYYYRIPATSSYPRIIGYGATGGLIGASFPHPTKMRAEPAPNKMGTWQIGNCNQPTVICSGSDGFLLYVTTTTLGSVDCYGNSSDDYLEFNAEL